MTRRGAGRLPGPRERNRPGGVLAARPGSSRSQTYDSERISGPLRGAGETIFTAKIPKAHGGCLGAGSRRRARQAAISCGEAQTATDPQIPEWGNPRGAMPAYPHLNQIGCEEATGGTETSKYPEEEKSTEIPGVAASETGPAQTRARVKACRRFRAGVVGRGLPGAASPGGGQKPDGQRNGLGRPAEQGESPVREAPPAAGPRSQSSAGHVKPGAKQGGPPSKAKHSPMTDSEPVP